jgi:hypothetical protein
VSDKVNKILSDAKQRLQKAIDLVPRSSEPDLIQISHINTWYKALPGWLAKYSEWEVVDIVRLWFIHTGLSLHDLTGNSYGPTTIRSMADLDNLPTSWSHGDDFDVVRVVNARAEYLNLDWRIQFTPGTPPALMSHWNGTIEPVEPLSLDPNTGETHYGDIDTVFNDMMD